MSFGTRSCPGVEVAFRSRRRRLGDEVMRGLAKASVGRECDGLETNVEVLLFDDLGLRRRRLLGTSFQLVALQQAGVREPTLGDKRAQVSHADVTQLQHAEPAYVLPPQYH